ncbi:MAG: peptide chain release factor N(5)-glutamine methyltransferase [Cyanobacteria bacterium P01_A01_bin.123]
MEDGVPDKKADCLISGDRLWDWWQQAKQQAVEADVPAVELVWLLREITGLDRLALQLGSFRHQRQITITRSLDDLQTLWQQRIQARVPVQYLVGYTTWRNFRLQVSPAVLIPRPETELMIDIAVATVAQSPIAAELSQGIWVDLGTGSGAIAIGLATAFPNATVIATDISEAAIAIAQANAAMNQVSHRIEFRQGSWFEPLADLTASLAGMVSNPPYIPSTMIPNLAPEVARHEPTLALDGDIDGLGCLNQLVHKAPQYLREGGLWLAEMMLNQADSVSTLLEGTNRYRAIQVHPDLTGRDRFVSAIAT